ncbi:hypothetical protein K504DRAFT_506316 [Pleomassaria siparia CBS 279.74]|uniref:Uncharacterized protein n=1 Tax=Pleomassaria siparia CBS 279.74 TaxID=1314801 RepID=A0A6G1JYN9_9PLEO|nr:hypothetical protein K504DRAFT_506316 [Pleomassaria siparia CBS 279.74]
MAAQYGLFEDVASTKAGTSAHCLWGARLGASAVVAIDNLSALSLLLPFTTQHYTTLHYTTPHYTTPHHTSPHFTHTTHHYDRIVITKALQPCRLWIVNSDLRPHSPPAPTHLAGTQPQFAAETNILDLSRAAPKRMHVRIIPRHLPSASIPGCFIPPTLNRDFTN